MNVYKATLNLTENALSVEKVNITSGVKLKAGEGVLLKNTGSTEKTFSFVATTGASSLTKNDLKGVTIRTATSVLKSNTYYDCSHIMVLKKGTNQFGSYTGEAMPANKAFVPYTPSGSAPSAIRIVEIDNNATALNNIENSERGTKFIQNGHMYILRNGIIYDVMGNKVK